MSCRSLYKLLLLATAALPTTSIKADSTQEPALVFNEIMTANLDMILDPSYNYGSWIELYNPGSTDIDISGWYLSTDPADSRQYPLGSYSRIVKAGGFLTLWFGHQDDYCMQQIDMSLDYDGGTVTLARPNGSVVCSATYGVIPARISLARVTDGSQDWGLTSTPTPGATNAGSLFATEQLEAPVVSMDSRIFTGSLSFTVTIPDGATLYYTDNGSTPFLTDKTAKTSDGNFTVSGTKIYRFRLYKEGMLPSPVTTRSFIKTSNDYGVPVVSIVTDKAGLESSGYGMWAKGPHGKAGNGQTDLCNWNRDWDRSVNIEIFDVNGNMILNQEAEITPSGRYSRAYDPHPFKIGAKKKYGYNTYFGFTPFEDKPYNKYKSLKMRSGGNNYTTRLKDAALQQIILRSGFNLDCQSYQPVHHYINGVYKGIINIREPNNKDYAYSNYGFDEDEVDCFKLDHNFGNGGFVLTEGSRDPWDEWVTLSANAADESIYNRICQIVDVDEFANYMAIELFLYNQDWPRNNIKAHRNSTDGRFRFVVFDLDHAFGAINEATSVNPFSFFDSEEYYTGDQTGYKSAMVTLFHNMLSNDSFRRKFIDAFCIAIGSIFDTDRVKEIVDELEARAEREMAFKGESPKRDADLIRNTITYDYKSNRFKQLTDWPSAQLGTTAKKAQKNISSNIPQAVLTINGAPIPTNKFIWYVFLPATVKATAPVGYTFTGWKDRNGNIVSTSAEYQVSRSYEYLMASFVADSTVQRPVRINEISASNSVFINDAFKKHDWIELYNTTSADYDASGMFLSDKLTNPEKYALPQGTVIPAGGHLVVWCDKEDGTQIHASFKLDNKDNSVVVLTARDHSWADTLTYSSHTGYQSVGLYPDGGNKSYVMNRPSIGKANTLSSYDKADRDNITVVRRLAARSKSGVIYNLLGKPEPNPQPGQVYIKDGHKFIYRP